MVEILVMLATLFGGSLEPVSDREPELKTCALVMVQGAKAPGVPTCPDGRREVSDCGLAFLNGTAVPAHPVRICR